MQFSNINNILSEINHNGFSKNYRFFNDKEVNFLANKCQMIFKQKKVISYLDVESDEGNFYRNEFAEKSFFQTINTNIIGVDEELDIFINQILSNKGLRMILENFFGKNYVINNLNMRYADNNSKFLGWHQDDPSAITLSILLNDVNDESSTTTFIKGSHMFKHSFGNSLEKLNPIYFKKISYRSTGNKGEVGFFSNATLHGMQVGNPSLAIFCCFIPDRENNKKLIFPDQTLYNKDYKVILDNELGRLFNFTGNKKNIDNSKITVKENNFTHRRLTFKSLIMYSLLSFLSIILACLKYLFNIFKK
tara:strand:+ start:1124 stop:2041 length:918 start_codon:yes stop_codon:yes gene_type:complete